MAGGFETGLPKDGGSFKAGGGGGFQTGLRPKSVGVGGTALGGNEFRLKGASTITNARGGSGGGGILGRIGHFIGSKAALAGHDIQAMPGGLYQVGKQGLEDQVRPVSDLVHGRFSRIGHDEMRELRDTYKLGKSFGNSFLTSVEHPLRDPFMTALNLAPALGAVGRVGEAGLAAREAVASGEDAASAARAAAKAALRSHNDLPTRELRRGGRIVKKDGVTMRIGGERTPMLASRNAGVRFFVQRPYDAAVQRAMDREAEAQGMGRVTARVAKHGAKRVGAAIAEEQRAVQRMNAVDREMLDRQAVKLSKIPLKMGSKLHSAATFLTSQQVPADTAAAYHEARAAELGQLAREGQDAEGRVLTKQERGQILQEAKRHKAAGSMFRKVQERDMVHVDASRPDGQKVFINPQYKRLAAADQQYAATGANIEKIQRDYGLMSRQGQVERLNAPAKVYAGAHYVEPTPGRLGEESPALKGARAQLAKVEKIHERAVQKAIGKISNSRSVMHQFASREMTDAEAHARLAELNKHLDEIHEKAIPHVTPYANKAERAAEQLRRNEINGKLAKGKTVRGASKIRETVKEEELRLAADAMRKAAEQHPEDPASIALLKMLKERDTLQQALTHRAEAPIFGHEPAPLPHVAQPGLNLEQAAQHDPVVIKTASAVSHMKDRVQALEALHHNRIEPTGFVGAGEHFPGRTFVSGRTSMKVNEPTPVTASGGRIVSMQKNPIDSRVYKGEGIRQALIPKNVYSLMSRHARIFEKFANTDSLRNAMIRRDSSLVKRSADDTLIRVDQHAGQVPAEVKQIMGHEMSTVHDAHSMQEAAAGVEEGAAAAHRMFAQHILEKHLNGEAQDYGIGEHAPPGFRWVNKNLVHEIEKDAAPVGTGKRLLPVKLMDNVNTAITAMTVYFKISHTFTRGLTNLATNIMQGSARPDEALKSFRLWRELTPRDKLRVLAAAGQQGFASLPMDAGLEGRISHIIEGGARGGAMFWARHFDAPFRANSLLFELRKAGYTSKGDVLDALDAIRNNGKGMSAAKWSKLSAAFRRADREAISYDRLADWEKRFLARAIWFYPWVKGSSSFAVRSILEHPVKMAALGQAAQVGRKQQDRFLGALPSYEQGLIPLGKGKHGLVPTVDANTFSPGGTLGQLLNIPNVKGSLLGQLNPATGAAIQAMAGINQYGEPSNSPWADALMSLVSPTTEAQVAEAFMKGNKGKSARMFPDTTGLSQIERAIGGPGLVSRRVNKAALHKAAAREHAKRYTVYSAP